tara:strand:+ start:104 stop:253 length:150 start_codon:yes stop_codon:yes gene_type:complete
MGGSDRRGCEGRPVVHYGKNGKKGDHGTTPVRQGTAAQVRRHQDQEDAQ